MIRAYKYQIFRITLYYIPVTQKKEKIFMVYAQSMQQHLMHELKSIHLRIYILYDVQSVQTILKMTNQEHSIDSNRWGESDLSLPKMH
jgi:hypothetical protein